jgi:hypothetical protein
MNITDVDKALKEADLATTKAQLQDAVTPFGIDLDLRQTMASLKEGITAALNDVRADLHGEPGTGEKPADTATGAAPEPDIQLPTLGDEPEPEPKQPAAGRILRHKETGREFVWTPALAKLANLEEV